jgi:hypothetical protein
MGRLSENFVAPVFENLFDFLAELVGQGAIDQAMVGGQRQVHHRADGDGVVNNVPEVNSAEI